jgi:hypothetical protein
MKNIKVKVAAFRTSDLKRVTGLEVGINDIFPALDDPISDTALVCIRGNMIKIKRHWLLLIKGPAESMLSINPKLSEQGSFRIE